MSYIFMICQLIPWTMYDIAIIPISGNVIHFYDMSTDPMENVWHCHQLNGGQCNWMPVSHPVYECGPKAHSQLHNCTTLPSTQCRHGHTIVPPTPNVSPRQCVPVWWQLFCVGHAVLTPSICDATQCWASTLPMQCHWCHWNLVSQNAQLQPCTFSNANYYHQMCSTCRWVG